MQDNLSGGATSISLIVMSKGGGENSRGVDSTCTGLFRPLPIALIIGGLYLVFCSAYIWLSGLLAVEHASTMAQLARIETVKGLIFVLVCAVVIALMSWWLLRRLAKEQDEVAANQMALIMTERRAMAGTLASTIAHDMNNILTVGCASSELLTLGKSLTPDQQELVNDINDSFKRMMDLAKRLSTMGRAGTKISLRPCDLCKVVQEEVAFARRHERLKKCQIQVEAPDPITVPLHPPIFQHLLLNLLLNAADATQGEGRIEVKLRQERSSAFLDVHDSGPGIPPEERDRIFDPFYSTKPNGQGLGLLSVKASAQMHRGRVVVLESPLGGACFRVSLPLENPAA